MNIGINIVGVSGDGSELYKGRDWKIQKEIIMSQIINCWKGHDISLYITTYEHSEIQEMISFYNPKKIITLDFFNSNMQITYLKSLQQLVGENLDFIVSVRPDFFPFEKISEYPIQFDKFNFLHKQGSLWEKDVEYADYETAITRWKVHIHPTYHLVNDTLFMFPVNMLGMFIETIQNLYDDTHFPGFTYATMHNVWIHLRKFLNTDQIHYIFSEPVNFINADIDKAMMDFNNVDYLQKQYFLCRNADHHLESYNRERDWKQFVEFMKKRLNIT